MLKNDTIAAISTAPGVGGIGIVRVSGKDAISMVDSIYVHKKKKRLKDAKTHTICYGKIIDPDTKQIVDEVLVLVMRSPGTYTKEDIVEIDCHGGLIQVRRVLEAVLKTGARLADPGEFTKRAFLNGRIDLLQAEAVIDLINAKAEIAARAALHSMEGRLSARIRSLRQKLIELIARIEVTVDYPEEDIEDVTGEEVYHGLKEIRQELEGILEDSKNGKIIREGIKAAIIGKPNVGKSSLLNELAGENRAIVTEIAGTTRDVIEEFISIEGIPIKLIDTAGIRETEDLVERIGVEKAEKKLDQSDLVILMLDGSQKLTREDRRIIQKLREKKVIVILNKIDLGLTIEVDELKKTFDQENLLLVSVTERKGIDKLKKNIVNMFVTGKIEADQEDLLTNIRHINLVEGALKNLDEAMDAHLRMMPIDFMTIDINNAAERLGEITGESVKEDVMNEIFSRFCVGK